MSMYTCHASSVRAAMVLGPVLRSYDLRGPATLHILGVILALALVVT